MWRRYIGVSGLPAIGSTVKAPRKILIIACVIALAVFGAAACGKKSEGGGGGGERRRDQRRDDVVPRLRRPAALLHRRGVGGPLERLHAPADLQARQGQGRHPGGAGAGQDDARNLRRRQDVQAQAAART